MPRCRCEPQALMRTSFYIDCSPGSLGIPEYVAGVPSWAPPTKCALNPNPSLADGGAVRNCRSHQEECRRIHKALEKKSLQPSVMFCPLQDMVYIHYNDGDAWERSGQGVRVFINDQQKRHERPVNQFLRWNHSLVLLQ